MRKITGIALLMVGFFAISCSESPRDTIVGQWVDEDTEIGLTINADGSIYEIEGGRKSNEGTWKLSESAPWVLRIYENGKLEAEISVKVINNNEIEFSVEDETMRMKRRK